MQALGSSYVDNFISFVSRKMFATAPHMFSAMIDIQWQG